MIVYHGSLAKFEQFDASKMGLNGTSEGKGFYFTDTRHIAEGYGHNGYLYTVEFNGKKPLSDTTLTVTKPELRKFLEALHKETEYLSNWGEVDYSGFNQVMEDALAGELDSSENDVDLIAGICNTSGNTGRALELVYEVLGFDSIITTEAQWGGEQTIYIALVNDIIEIKEVLALESSEYKAE